MINSIDTVGKQVIYEQVTKHAQRMIHSKNDERVSD